jgi:hypothetical protein
MHPYSEWLWLVCPFAGTVLKHPDQSVALSNSFFIYLAELILWGTFRGRTVVAKIGAYNDFFRAKLLNFAINPRDILAHKSGRQAQLVIITSASVGAHNIIIARNDNVHRQCHY